jgi:glycosyltransferase involved in cell wall biosynthesis
MTARHDIKVVHLSTVHSADDPRAYGREARTLAAAGFDVVMVGCTPRAAPIDDSVAMRVLPSRSGRLARVTIGLVDAVRAVRKERPAIVHFHDPELLAVAWLFRLLGIAPIYDVHENLREQVLSKAYLSPSVRRIASKLIAVLEPIAARPCAAVVIVDPQWSSHFPRQVTFSLDNSPIRSEWVASTHVPVADRDNVFVYVGTVTEARGALDMVRAINQLDESLHAKLVVAGKASPESILAKMRELDVHSRVDFVGWKSRSEIVDLIGSSLVGLLLLHPEKNYLQARATKLFEYMLSGIPTIATNLPGSRSVIEAYDCGLLVEPHDIEGTAAAMDRLARDHNEVVRLGTNGQDNAVSFDAQVPGFVALYDKIAKVDPIISASGPGHDGDVLVASAHFQNGEMP